MRIARDYACIRTKLHPVQRVTCRNTRAHSGLKQLLWVAMHLNISFQDSIREIFMQLERDTLGDGPQVDQNSSSVCFNQPIR